MSIFENIINGFNGYIDAISGNTEPLTPHLAEAAHLMAHTLLEERKIFCCTSGHAFAAGQQFCANLGNSQNLQRPGLPTVFLGNSQQHTLAMIDQQQSGSIYARQIQALGQPGDLLFVIATSGQEKPLLQAVQTAGEQQIACIAMAGGPHPDIHNALCSQSVNIPLRCESYGQLQAMQFLAVCLLGDLVEQLLFGTPT
ncbi:MAG TPA: SIS domain-containing protein [Pseudomonadales bacterium]